MNRFLYAIMLVVLSCSLSAQELAPAPDAAVQCTVCHGAQLMGNPNTGAPRLSGLSDWYIKKQINAFKKGWRGQHPDDHSGAEMYPTAVSLDEASLEGVLAFIKLVDKPKLPTTIEGDAQRGSTIYLQCSACHGAAGKGNKLLGAPNLTALNDWYLLKQLKHFKSGIRGADSDDPSILSMLSAAQMLEDEQAMKDVIAYITQLQNEQEN